MPEEITREDVCGPTTSRMVEAWIVALVPRITDRASLVDAMCHVMRRSQGSSECEFCDGGKCDKPEAHAAADLAMAYAASREGG